MIHWAYILGFIIWGLLLLSFYFKEYPLGTLAAALMVVYGVYIMINGLDAMILWVFNAVGLIHIFLGGYIFIKGSYDIYSKEL